MIFWLGIHEVSWMNHLDVPVMVSRRRLAERGCPRSSRVPWVLDSGGFTELAKFGGWSIGSGQYAEEVRSFAARIPRLVWCAPQDWMCEDHMIERTGLSVIEHQDRTLANFLDLAAESIPVIPVLQGQTIDDYVRHVADYASAGVDLSGFAVVGLGSVCRRETTTEIAEIVAELTDRIGPRLHGFGCKAGALSRVGGLLASADSMAWSLAGKKRGPCTHLKSRCANHRHYALAWRERVLAQQSTRPVQRMLDVFGTADPVA